MSRDKILSNIGALTEPIKPLEWSIDKTNFKNPLDKFKQMLIVAGGEAIEINSIDIDTIKSHFKENKLIIDTTLQNTQKDTIAQKEYDITVIEAKFAVAENGAVWIEWNERYPRFLITLSKSLAIILKKDKIVDTMQEAYSLIDFNNISYALFLSGPSKTADIEQSLVFGAHGAKELKVFLRE